MSGTAYTVDTSNYTVTDVARKAMSQTDKFLRKYSNSGAVKNTSIVGREKAPVVTSSSTKSDIAKGDTTRGGGIPPKPVEADKKLLLISPQSAKDLLAKNFKNRKVNREYMRTLAKQMQAGNWYPKVSDNIHVSEDGFLLNGQHRLLAVIESGTAGQWFYFQMNVTKEEAAYIDSGRKRSTSDALAMSIGVDWFTPLLSSMLKVAVVSAKGVLGDISETQNFVMEYEVQLKETLEFFKGKYMSDFRHRAFVATIFLALCYGIPYSKLQEYKKPFEMGYDDKPQGKTAAALARLLRDLKRRKTLSWESMSESQLLNKCQHNLYLYLHGKCVDKVCESKEYHYPKLVMTQTSSSTK